jgi:hypothetical protein
LRDATEIYICSVLSIYANEDRLELPNIGIRSLMYLKE